MWQCSVPFYFGAMCGKTILALTCNNFESFSQCELYYMEEHAKKNWTSKNFKIKIAKKKKETEQIIKATQC